MKSINRALVYVSILYEQQSITRPKWMGVGSGKAAAAVVHLYVQIAVSGVFALGAVCVCVCVCLSGVDVRCMRWHFHRTCEQQHFMQ